MGNSRQMEIINSFTTFSKKEFFKNEELSELEALRDEVIKLSFGDQYDDLENPLLGIHRTSRYFIKHPIEVPTIDWITKAQTPNPFIARKIPIHPEMIADDTEIID